MDFVEQEIPNKEIDIAEFLDNLLSFITKMEYSGYQSKKYQSNKIMRKR
jgi:hypothetical protein